jgi:hypothetical protein
MRVKERVKKILGKKFQIFFAPHEQPNGRKKAAARKVAVGGKGWCAVTPNLPNRKECGASARISNRKKNPLKPAG